MDPIRRLARRIAAVEKLAFKAATQPQLAHSSIEDGAIKSVVDGELKAIIGRQFDGTQAAAVITGPTPPAPTVPLVTPMPGALRIYWDGTFDSGALTPMDFSRVLVYAVPSIAFTGINPVDQTVIVGQISSATGGEITAALDPGVEYVVYLVAWSQAGKYSAGSSAVASVPQAVEAPIAVPESSPVITVTSNPLGFTVVTGNFAPTTRVEYHVSATPGFTPSEATLLPNTPTRSQVMTFRAMPDGTKFLSGETYYFKALAVNDIGPADAPSSEVSALFSGQFSLEGVEIVGPLMMRGGASVSSKMVLEFGVTDPTQFPLAASGWPTLEIPAAAGYRYGCSPSSDGDYYWTVRWNGGLNTASNNYIEKIDKATGAVVSSVMDGAGWGALGGIVRIGTNLYVLFCDSVSGGFDRSNWRVNVYDEATVTFQTSWRAMGQAGNFWTSKGDSCIGTNDAGDVVIADIGPNGDYHTFVDRFNPDTGARLGRYTGDYFTQGFSNLHIQAVRVTSTGFAGERIVIGSGSALQVFNSSTGARVASEEWPRGTTGNVAGVFLDEGVWHTFHNTGSGTASKVVNYTWNTGSADFAYTQYDPVSPTHETAASPVLTASVTKYATWIISIPSGPEDAGPSDPNAASDLRIYAAPTGGTLRLQGSLNRAQIAAGQLQLGLASIDTTATLPTPPPSNEFALLPGAVGSIGASTDDWEANGDGTWRFDASKNIDDVGWQTLPLESGYTAYSSADLPQFRWDGTHLSLRGRVKPTSGSFGTSQVRVAIIPTDYRPLVEEGHQVGTDDASGARLVVDTDGSVYVWPGASTALVYLSATFRID